MSRLILITNPGSASRKYALYDGDKVVAKLHFEFEENDADEAKVVCTLKNEAGDKKNISVNLEDLNGAIGAVPKILDNEGYTSKDNQLQAVAVRIVAPGDYFVEDHIVDDEYMEKLAEAEKRNPVHVPTTANEIKGVREAFPGIKIISISDSAFHWSKPETSKYYSFDLDLANKYEIKRYGYHGLSYGFISRYMKEKGILPRKLIALHLGSGCSASAILNGLAMDNSMGYTPAEGLAMSTRIGTIDAAGALALKGALGMKSDEEFLLYLNKQCGLKGLSGGYDDLRDVIRRRDEGHMKAMLAHSIFVYRIQSYIGQMAAMLNGCDAIVFAGTIGERSVEVRRFISNKLGYLGFKLDPIKNDEPEFTDHHAIVSANDSKPMYLIETDETAQMIYRAQAFLKD